MYAFLGRGGGRVAGLGMGLDEGKRGSFCWEGVLVLLVALEGVVRAGA